MRALYFAVLTAVMFSGCSYATMRLVYSDARVVYEDAHYVVHEIQEVKK